MMGITIIEQQTMQAIQDMARSLNRIANCLEAQEKRARETEPTTPADIEALGPTLQAVKEGLAGLSAIPDPWVKGRVQNGETWLETGSTDHTGKLTERQIVCGCGWKSSPFAWNAEEAIEEFHQHLAEMGVEKP